MDNFSAFPTTPISPARSAEVIIPNDSTDLSQVSRAVYAAAAGDLTVEMADGQTVTFASVPAGVIIPIRVKKVLATGTSAGGLVSLW